jgi:hypothetical protein
MTKIKKYQSGAIFADLLRQGENIGLQGLSFDIGNYMNQNRYNIDSGIKLGQTTSLFGDKTNYKNL